MQLAVKIRSQPARNLAWADLWRFVTDVHCVHHFDEAVNFELPYTLEILAALLQEEQRQEEKLMKSEEWEAELRRGEQKEEARRYAQKPCLEGHKESGCRRRL